MNGNKFSYVKTIKRVFDMSEEEESTYFDIYKEPLPKELPPKTITFIINPTLNDIWTRLGYRDPDIAIETNKLDIALTKTYLEFMADAAGKFDETIHKIHDHKKEFQRVKKLYGDKNSKLEVSDHLSLIDQERLTNREIEKLHNKYAPRLEVLKKLCQKCRKHFDKLGIEEEARGDYNELGNTDYTQERVEGFKKMLNSLKREESNRVNIFNSCEKSIRSISEELNEPLSQEIDFVLTNKLYDNDSISALTQASEDLTALKIKRYQEYDELVGKVQHLYSVLMIQPEDQLKLPEKPTPTSEILNQLRKELDSLEKAKDENREALIAKFQEEIDQLCDEMRVPEKLRPKYVGFNLDDKLDFMEREASSMRERRAKTQPIIEVLSAIEEVKSRLPAEVFEQKEEEDEEDDDKKKYRKKYPNISHQLDSKVLDQHVQMQIDTELLPLEKKLLDLLLQFRKENGYDFQFEGVTYIDTLSQIYLADDSDKFGTTVLDRKTPVVRKAKIPATSPRATTYTRSPKKYVSKKSPYTPRKTKKPLFEE